MATKQQQLSISISTINDTDYLGKGISIYLFLSHQRHPAVIAKTQTPRRNILRMLTLDADFVGFLIIKRNSKILHNGIRSAPNELLDADIAQNLGFYFSGDFLLRHWQMKFVGLIESYH
jgi:hypothetical protein